MSAFAERPRFLQEVSQRQWKASTRQFDFLGRRMFSIPEVRKRFQSVRGMFSQSKSGRMATLVVNLGSSCNRQHQVDAEPTQAQLDYLLFNWSERKFPLDIFTGIFSIGQLDFDVHIIILRISHCCIIIKPSTVALVFPSWVFLGTLVQK